MALVLIVRKLDVEVRDVQAVQLLAKVLVVAGGRFRHIFGRIKGAAGGEADADLHSRKRGGENRRTESVISCSAMASETCVLIRHTDKRLISGCLRFGGEVTKKLRYSSIRYHRLNRSVLVHAQVR